MVTDLGSAPTCPCEAGQVSEPPFSCLWTWKVFPTLLSSQSRVGVKGIIAEMAENLPGILGRVVTLTAILEPEPGAPGALFLPRAGR